MRRFATAVACLAAAVAAAPAALAAPAPTATATAPTAVAPSQEIVVVGSTRAARARPDARGAPVALVRHRRPITRGPTALPVLARATDARGGQWLRVRLPGRVLGRAAPRRIAWISAAHTRVSATAWHLVVDLSARTVGVYREGRRLRTLRAVIGAPATPTPKGSYFVEENVRMPSSFPGGPFALALSARSGVLQEFAGGPGQIALHGRRGVGGELGTAVSHGCVRLDDAAITWLAARVPPGAPVTVVR